MRIAVNTRMLMSNKLDGIGWFSYETLKRITQQNPEVEFAFIFDRQYSDEFIFGENIEPFVCFPPARHPFLYYLWYEWSIPRVLHKWKPDLFLSPDGYLSMSANVKSLAVIHDINFYHFKKSLPRSYSWFYNYYFPRYAKKAERIATVSQFSKQDISKAYDVEPNKIDVVYNGVNEIYCPISPPEIEATQVKHSQACPYFLFVGTLLQRKNLVNLLKGFDGFKKKNSNNVKLLIIGNKKWWTSDMETTYKEMQHKQDVIFKSYVSPPDLHLLIGSAIALSFIPFFEGFGIPIIEAMRCGIPVITSNASSTAEIGKDAAILVNPSRPDELSVAMKQVWDDPELRQDLIVKGTERAKQFSWDKTADNLWASIQTALK